MKIDVDSPFGSYAPSRWLATAIKIGQHVPNFLGQQFAQLIRKIVIYKNLIPLDLEVEGMRFRFYVKDNNSEKKFAFMPWRFDKKERRYVTRHLPADGVFVDIGANVGIYTLHAAKALGERGRILAFEPNPPAFARLSFNIASCESLGGGYRNIKALNIGISDKQEQLELHLHARNLGGSSILPASRSRAGVTTIQCRPLLDVLAEESIDKVDILKIDIEGAEDIALAPFLEQAGDRLLPRHLIIENSEDAWKIDLFARLGERGYQVVLRNRRNTVLSRVAASP